MANRFNLHIEELEKRLQDLDPMDQDYPTVLSALERCSEIQCKRMKLETEDRALKTKNGVSKDVLVQSVASLAGLCMILNFEKLGVITTKGLSLLKLGIR